MGRKTNPLGKTVYSIITAQHQRIAEWLQSLPFVDPKRMAFYGLSYGGKTAVRVPPLLDKYAVLISSGDFNEWNWKNTSATYRRSTVFTKTYELAEFNVGNTFNYAEMAAMFAPRPFMVERGHKDKVAPDEWVAYEYAKVRRLYSMLKAEPKTEIDFFDGPHEIHGVATFDFLQRHLAWPPR